MYKEEKSMELPEVVDFVRGEERVACWADLFREKRPLEPSQLVSFFLEGRFSWFEARFERVNLDPASGFLLVWLPNEPALKKIPFRNLVGFKWFAHEGHLMKRRRTLDLSESFS